MNAGRSLTISCNHCPNVMHFEGDFEITDALALADKHEKTMHPKTVEERAS